MLVQRQRLLLPLAHLLLLDHSRQRILLLRDWCRLWLARHLRARR